jgi:hypothetical protein
VKEHLQRGALFVLLILADALIGEPTSGFLVVVGLMLMGIVTFDQITRVFTGRDSASEQVHQEGDQPQIAKAMDSRLRLRKDQRRVTRRSGASGQRGGEEEQPER